MTSDFLPEQELIASVLADPQAAPVLFEPAASEDQQQPEAFIEPVTAVEEQKRSFFQRLGSVALAAKTDVMESSNKVRTAVAGVGVVALQALSRLQASWVFVPKAAVDTYKSTKSPLLAGLAGGSAFLGWCLATGGVTTEGLQKFPRAMEEANNSFPTFVDFFKDSLSGFDRVEFDPTASFARARYIGKSALSHVKRGLTVMGIGSAVYAGTASAKGRSRKAVHKLNVAASLDGGVATGAFVYTIAEVISRIADSNPLLAEHIQNVASDIKLWYGVAAAMMIESFVENKIKRSRKKIDEHSDQQDPELAAT